LSKRDLKIRGLALYPKRMNWVDIYLLRSDLIKVLDRLHDRLIIQFGEKIGTKESRIDPNLIEVKSRLDKIIEFLIPMKPKNKGILTPFLEVGSKKTAIDPSFVSENVGAWLKKAEKEVQPLKKEMDMINDDRAYITDIKERLTSLTGLDVDLLAISSLTRVRIKVGTTRRYSELLDEMKKLNADMEGSLLDKKEGIHSVRILYTKSNAGKVEDAIRGRLFSEINLDIPRMKIFLRRRVGSTDIMGEPILKIINKLEILDNQLEKMLAEISLKGSSIALKVLHDARTWREAVEIEIDKKAVSSTLTGTAYTRQISGFVEADRVGELKDVLAATTKGRYHIDQRDPTSIEIEENKVPTKLDNGKFVSLFEPLTLTFSTPRYNEIDPSAWISIPFILFFGLMLGDAGYGLLILLPSIYIFVKGKKSRALRSIGALGILMGLATTMAGIWMGAFFGDLIPRLIYDRPGDPLFAFTILGYKLPYDTLKDPMILFQISLWLGLAQLNLGFILLGIDRLKKKSIWGFIKGALSWFLIQAGAVIFIGALLIGWWELDTVLMIIGGSTFISGSILLFFEVGPMFLFNIEGLLGDWISYTRILALGLSTFGLAMAFNIVGEMLVDIHWGLVVVVVVLLLVLHVFNLLLQALGSAVHSIRLQFVEFFGRFFEGGGELFEPFGREREFTIGPDEKGMIREGRQ
jgi:V/A-type H+-transporting ATPase subunit I